MIKTSTFIPSNIPDGSNPQELQDFLNALKMVVEEITRKAKSIQTEVRSAVPTTTDQFEVEGEDVRYVSGATYRTYSLINGVIRYHAES